MLRAAFVFAGASLIHRFWWTLLGFGVLLIASGVKVIRHRNDEGTRDYDRVLRILGRFIPVSDKYDGGRFITTLSGRRAATPLLAALVVVEATDIVCAVDSVPAILAVSREPFLVIACNAFAILGLRALYFLLANAKERFHYLAHALGGILVLVGTKMVVSHWYHVPTAYSLVAIMAMLAISIAASEWRRVRRANSRN